MTATTSLLACWVAFAITHMLLAARRQNLIHSVGPRLYALIYNGIAFACFIPLVWIYSDNRHGGALLWAAPSWLQHMGMALSLLGISLLPASILRSSPVGMIPTQPEAQGLLRITRHPLFTALGLWGLGHSLMFGFATDVAFFAGFTLFGLIGSAHQDSRKRREESERLGPFMASTSLLPFAAILSGRNQLVLKELPWLHLILGLGLGLFIYWAHPLMFN